MRQKRRLLLLLGALGIIVTVILVVIIGLYLTKAELEVQTNEESEVYIDGQYVGSTPVTKEVDNMNATLKIVPKSKGSALLPYETALSLTPRTKVIVRHNFKNEKMAESTQILSLVKISGNDAFFTITTNPPNSMVFFNNEYVGTTPLRISREPNTYSVQIVKEGFGAVQLSLKNATGYSLMAYVDLATSITAKAAASETLVVTTLGKSEELINVHTKPSPYSDEIARILPGHEYPLKSYSDDKAWIQIRLNESQDGWISSKFATVSAQMATPP